MGEAILEKVLAGFGYLLGAVFMSAIMWLGWEIVVLTFGSFIKLVS